MLSNTELAKIFFSIASFLGLPIVLLPLLAFAFRNNLQLLIRAAIVFAIVELVCAAIKLSYRKKRPIPSVSKTLYQAYNSGSFPSVHTARAAAFSTIIAMVHNSKATIAAVFLLTALIAYSRIYLRKHYLIDVLAGFAIGAVVALGGLNL